jgi:hypothetical protein
VPPFYTIDQNIYQGRMRGAKNAISGQNLWRESGYFAARMNGASVDGCGRRSPSRNLFTRIAANPNAAGKVHSIHAGLARAL